MRRLFNKLFGWEYANVRYGFYYYTRRIHTNPDGIRFVVVHDEVIKEGRNEWFQVL